MRLAKKQWDEIGYTYAGEKPHYFETTVDGVTVRLGLAKHIMAQEVMELGLMPLLGPLRAILCKPEVQTTARKAQLAKNRDKNGLNLGLSRSIARGKEGGNIQYGKAVWKIDELAELNAILEELGPQLIEYAFTKTKGEIFVEKWAGNASLTNGHHNNIHTTSIQGKMNLVGADMNALGEFSGVHIDLNDDRGHYSLGFFLSNIDTNNVWQGRFCIGSVCISCDAEPFSVFVFSAQQPHFGRDQDIIQQIFHSTLLYAFALILLLNIPRILESDRTNGWSL